ncbi:hypothetical protein SRB5_36160 [Streptomyces sp. RB5]|uniref:Cell wall-active antibiotics response LiaF-like C-terminal domain-containing protein n=1 Tax=Streptomyces smaragdinus TaxID=2585196 RepID=A0A7K0CJ31_9ACTN|nr:DUF1707 domain-containing protein [Streptomyces smaragdinus]MQY13468.1 hypothetical protein [Streptomyces smaragdinus]
MVKPAPAGERTPAALRASDADRDRVAEILREALAEGRLDAAEHAERIEGVYGAKTVAELEVYVADLPAGRPEAAAEPAPATSSSYSWGAPPAAKQNLVAILGGAVRKGRWRVPARINAVAICGGVDIDLTEAIFEHQTVVINTFSLCGGVSIRVPENVTLRESGMGIMGGFDVKAMEAVEPGAPVVIIEGLAIMGGVDAKPKRGKVVKDLSDKLRKHLGH